MCNEREDSVWFIHANPTDKNAIGGVPQIDESTTIVGIAPDDSAITSLTVNNIFTKDEHAGAGVNRKFDATLVDTIDEVYRANWDLPEYAPFRECIKRSIQDGIEAGMKRASNECEKKLNEKDKRIQELNLEAERWKTVFTELVQKCREGINAFDFISRVVHGSCGKKY